jgi:Raf kinase inhibitor-like YbhB/YbcL family protein
MKRITILVGLFALVAVAATAAEVMELTVTSSAFKNQGPIPSQYTCEGQQESPPVSWSALPPQTRSVAVIVDDPDAPGGTFEHLVLYNLPPTERTLPSQPAKGLGLVGHGAAGMNSNQQAGWAPICPPSGMHRYRFTVFGLDTVLQLPARATSRDLEQAMHGHVLARGELVGTYQKGAAKRPQPARPPQNVH